MSGRLSSFLPQLFMIMFGVLLLYFIPQQINDVSDTPIGPRFFPTMISIMIIVMSVSSLISAFLRNRKVVASEVEEQSKEQKDQSAYAKEKGYKQVGLTFAALIIWTLLMPMIGFVVTTFLLVLYLMYLMGNRQLIKMVMTSVIFTGLLYAVAAYLLQLSI